MNVIDQEYQMRGRRSMRCLTLEKPKALQCKASMAPLTRFELMTFRLGGGRSILLSYKGVYLIMHNSPIDPKNILLGGGRSILLSYKGVWIVDSYITL